MKAMTLLSIGLLGLSLGACAKTKSTAPPEVKVVGNSSCPVSGKPVAGAPAAPSVYSDYQGNRIGFMCPNCKAKFDGAVDAKKRALLEKALASARTPR